MVSHLNVAPFKKDRSVLVHCAISSRIVTADSFPQGNPLQMTLRQQADIFPVSIPQYCVPQIDSFSSGLCRSSANFYFPFSPSPRKTALRWAPPTTSFGCPSPRANDHLVPDAYCPTCPQREPYISPTPGSSMERPGQESRRSPNRKHSASSRSSSGTFSRMCKATNPWKYINTGTCVEGPRAHHSLLHSFHRTVSTSVPTPPPPPPFRPQNPKSHPTHHAWLDPEPRISTEPPFESCTLSDALLHDKKKLRVDLQDLKDYDAELGEALQQRPADFLPVVSCALSLCVPPSA